MSKFKVEIEITEDDIRGVFNLIAKQEGKTPIMMSSQKWHEIPYNPTNKSSISKQTYEQRKKAIIDIFENALPKIIHNFINDGEQYEV